MLWNLAIRTSLPQAINYYQEILTHYPDSNHAPQAQWWIFWHKYKLNENKAQLVSISSAAASKYNHSKLAGVFYFGQAKFLKQCSTISELLFIISKQPSCFLTIIMGGGRHTQPGFAKLTYRYLL